MIRRSTFSRFSFSSSSAAVAASIFRSCTHRHFSSTTNKENTTSTSAAAEEGEKNGAAAAAGGRLPHSWGFADVDSSGRTAMDYRHEAAMEQVRNRFSDPIVLPNADPSIDGPSDFLVGFSQYRWSLRESYRRSISMALNQLLLQQKKRRDENAAVAVDRIEPAQVDLSVAWTGRFALNKFRGLHKVLGVTLLAEDDSAAAAAETEKEGGKSQEASIQKKRLPDSGLKAKLIGDLAMLVNDQKTKCLVEVGIVRALPRDLLDENASNVGKKKNASVSDQDDFDAAVRAVLREIRSLSQRQRVLFVMNDQTEHECKEKLRPIIFSRKVSPLLVNIDDIGRDGNGVDNGAVPPAAVGQETPNLDDSRSFPTCLPPELFDASERRRIVLEALGQQFKRSLLEQAEAARKKKNRNKNDIDADESRQEHSSIRFPMIFINGAYLGSTRHLLRMGQEAKKLTTLIHQPGELKMKL